MDSGLRLLIINFGSGRGSRLNCECDLIHMVAVQMRVATGPDKITPLPDRTAAPSYAPVTRSWQC